MRTTEELIQELDHEGRNFTRCGLVIGFETSTIYVWGNDANRHRMLDEAVHSGGKPVGMIGYDMHNGLLSVHIRPLEEYAGEDWVAEYLEQASRQFSSIDLENRPSAGNQGRLRIASGWFS